MSGAIDLAIEALTTAIYSHHGGEILRSRALAELLELKASDGSSPVERAAPTSSGKEDVVLPWDDLQELLMYFITVGDPKAEAMLRGLRPLTAVGLPWKTGGEIGEAAKVRFDELDYKGWDWRSFYNGFLEGATARRSIPTTGEPS